MKSRRVSLGQLDDLRKAPDAELYLVKPAGWDFDLIRFASRLALREFNKRAKLRPLVFDVVPKGTAIHAHQREAQA